MYGYKYRWVIFSRLTSCVCFESQSTRELGKLSEGSSVTTKDLIVTPSQPDRHWPIYSEPTLLSNGSYAFLASFYSSHLSSLFPPPFPSWFSHDSLTAFCTNAVFLTSILAPYSIWSSSEWHILFDGWVSVKLCHLVRCKTGQMWLLHYYCLWLHL